MSSNLHVSLASDLTPPTPAHNLLLAFHFGTTPAPDKHPAIVSPQLPPIDRDQIYETWWVEDDVNYYTKGSFRIAECADYAFVIYEHDESGFDDHEAFTHAAYREMLDVVQSTQHPQLVKIWNYLGGINEGDGDDERYRQFSVGRAHAFHESGISDENSPTATGVGTVLDRGLAIIALCSTRDYSRAENPRQMSAYQYPRQYGPQSPKFGRGGSVATAGHHLHLLSGTAAIVGHESMHPDDTEAQLDETLRNIDSLCDAVTEVNNGDSKFVLDEQSVLRVYLRNPDDYPLIADRLKSRLGPSADQISYLHGNICRRELMIEIDGVHVQ